MKKVQLGNTKIKVSRLCFGSLTMTPFQANLSISEGAHLIEYGFERGINFLDTAEIYENYAYIKQALKGIKREEYTLASKTYAYTKEMARDSLEKALKEIGTDYIDLFLLHEQESIHTIRGHFEAIEYFIKAKEEGKIRAIGISTHKIAAAKAAKAIHEIEVIHPIVNKLGIGINDGTIEEMLTELKDLHNMGKGIYAMKPLGGGHLISDLEASFNFVKNIPYIDSIAIGLQSRDEIDSNVHLLENDYLPIEIKNQLNKKNRKLIVADYCIGCGNCQRRCQQDGIQVIDGIAVPNEKCILCGYCASVCPEFCIKVI